MKSEKDNVSQIEAEQPASVEDLPVDEEQQNQVRGGNTYTGILVLSTNHH